MDYGIPCHSSSVSRSSRMNPTAKNPIVWSVPFSQRIHPSATSLGSLVGETATGPGFDAFGLLVTREDTPS